ncbi:MAG: hypothetical protein BJ554DRAFT_6843 [Olpidium bornovanus]|uniref:Uncharacterized protein n=1 Tax=Olpidium bornovanus TaxID=278681 RepID=A0A8H8DJT8_9FUNG|nr:MAG: hypothetical protein BJ554DRAFT_6843 [Olpidium bornovanus]
MLEKYDDDVGDAEYDPDEELARKEHVEKYLRENQNTQKYRECDEDERPRLNALLARTLLGAVPTYNGAGGVPALNGFVNKLEMAAKRTGFNDEETLDLGVNRLMGQAAPVTVSAPKWSLTRVRRRQSQDDVTLLRGPLLFSPSGSICALISPPDLRIFAGFPSTPPFFSFLF